MKVAIVCDWLLGTGGAERVVLELHKMFPEAPIYTSQYNPNPKIWYGDKWFEGADIRTTWLQKLPKSLKKFLPLLRAWTFSRLDLSGYDLVISSSGAEAKFVKTGDWGLGTGDSNVKRPLHICYCHSPTHYYWSRHEEYLDHPGFGWLDPLASLGLKLLVGPMRRWDFRAAQRPNHFIANSNYTKQQIKKYYGREATVIHPPVDIERFKETLNKPARRSLGEGGSSILRKGFVVAGRQTPYKKIDIAVRAATALNVPLIVIGRGPHYRNLKGLAGHSVTFLRGVSDEEMPQKFAEAEAFIFPGIDDFGIVAVEAMAAGTPIIAYKDGGALDYINKTTGLFFDKPTPEALGKAMQEFSKHKFNHSKITTEAEKFSSSAFKTKIKAFVNKLTNDII